MDTPVPTLTANGVERVRQVLAAIVQDEKNLTPDLPFEYRLFVYPGPTKFEDGKWFLNHGDVKDFLAAAEAKGVIIPDEPVST